MLFFVFRFQFLKAKQMVHPDDLPQRFFSTFIGWLRQRGIGQDKVMK